MIDFDHIENKKLQELLRESLWEYQEEKTIEVFSNHIALNTLAGIFSKIAETKIPVKTSFLCDDIAAKLLVLSWAMEEK